MSVTPSPRPGRYTKAVARRILNRIAAGESLLSICADEHMPCYRTVMNWAARREEFKKEYARARTIQAHALADEVLNTARADLAPADKSARIRALTWAAAKLHPRQYGEKPEGLEDAGASVFTVVVKQHATPEDARDRKTGG